MHSASTRLFAGFAAGGLSHLIFQGALGIIFYVTDLVPELVWSLEPVPPLGVPATANNVFWDGLWGMAYGLLEPWLTRRFGRSGGGILLAAASLSIFWFVVLPLKGAGIGGGFDAREVLVDLAFDATFGLGTALVFWGLMRRARPRPMDQRSEVRP